MAGLVPAIHVFALTQHSVVDARDKRGHDDSIKSHPAVVRHIRRRGWHNDVHLPYPNGLMLSATESAMCSLVMMPTTSDDLPRPPAVMTTAMAAWRRDMR
jgi:hypothetical protein